MLPLAARRTVDAARFMLEGGRPEAAAILTNKARLFGEANYHAVCGRWSEVAELVDL